MELTEIDHVLEDEIFSYLPDIFIAASGFESRSTSIPHRLEKLAGTKVVIGFKDGLNDICRPENDQFFMDNEYEYYYVSAEEKPDFATIFNNKSFPEKLKVMIDISVMTRSWYHAFLAYFYMTDNFVSVNVMAVYTPAIYKDVLKLSKKFSLKEFKISDEEKESDLSNKKVALILGLGFEENVSPVVINKFNPETVLLMYAEPEEQKEYVESIFISNFTLINKTPIHNLKGYSLSNTTEIYKLLVDTILPLREQYKIVIIPQGPKIFSFISMILKMNYHDISLVFPNFKSKKIRDIKPSDKLIGIKLIFEED